IREPCASLIQSHPVEQREDSIPSGYIWACEHADIRRSAKLLTAVDRRAVPTILIRHACALDACGVKENQNLAPTRDQLCGKDHILLRANGYSVADESGVSASSVNLDRVEF